MQSSSTAILENVGRIRELIQRIRQNEGVGSSEDELTLHRALHDLDYLIDMIADMRRDHEKIIQERDHRIRELENHE